MPKKKRVSIKEIERHVKNPFIDKLGDSFEVIRRRKPGGKIMVMDTAGVAMTDSEGRPVIATMPGEVAYTMKDNKPYVKLFESTVIEMSDLPSNALKLLIQIILMIKPNRDFVFLERVHMRKACDWGADVTFYEAMTTLIDKEFIAPADYPTVKYWLNPEKLYNGDRRKLLPKK